MGLNAVTCLEKNTWTLNYVLGKGQHSVFSVLGSIINIGSIISMVHVLENRGSQTIFLKTCRLVECWRPHCLSTFLFHYFHFLAMVLPSV